jgi:hypothetical protein
VDVTVRFDSATNEYSARDSQGKLVGSCYFLKEYGGGTWKWEVKGGPAGIQDNRENSLRLLHIECTKKLQSERQAA